jgi:hypothetical protein
MAARLLAKRPGVQMIVADYDDAMVSTRGGDQP